MENFTIDASLAAKVQLDLLVIILASQRANSKLIIDFLSKKDEDTKDAYAFLNECLVSETQAVLNLIYKEYGNLDLKVLGLGI